MGKFFPASTRHVKAQEFLELKQGTMTVIEYVAKFTKLTVSLVTPHSRGVR